MAVGEVKPLPPGPVTESGHPRYVCPVHGAKFRGSMTKYLPGQGESVLIFYVCGCEFVRQIDRSKVRTP